MPLHTNTVVLLNKFPYYHGTFIQPNCSYLKCKKLPGKLIIKSVENRCNMICGKEINLYYRLLHPFKSPSPLPAVKTGSCIHSLFKYIIMFAKNKKDVHGLTIRAYQGDAKVMLVFNLPEDKITNL